MWPPVFVSCASMVFTAAAPGVPSPGPHAFLGRRGGHGQIFSFLFFLVFLVAISTGPMTKGEPLMTHTHTHAAVERKKRQEPDWSHAHKHARRTHPPTHKGRISLGRGCGDRASEKRKERETRGDRQKKKGHRSGPRLVSAFGRPARVAPLQSHAADLGGTHMCGPSEKGGTKYFIPGRGERERRQRAQLKGEWDARGRGRRDPKRGSARGWAPRGRTTRWAVRGWSRP